MIDQDDPEIQDSIARGVADGIRLAREQEAEAKAEAKRNKTRKQYKFALSIFLAGPALIVVSGIMICATGYEPPRFVIPATVNVRSGPGTDHEAVGQLAGMTSVKVVRKNHGWSSVAYKLDGKQHHGWIRSDLIGGKSAAEGRIQKAEMDLKLAARKAQCATTDPRVLDPLVYKYTANQAVLVHDSVWHMMNIDTKENTQRYFLRCKNVWEIKSANDGRTLAKFGAFGGKVNE